jgi:hypothetical protein
LSWARSAGLQQFRAVQEFESRWLWSLGRDVIFGICCKHSQRPQSFPLPPSRSFKCTSWTKVLLPLHFSNLTYKPLTTNCLSKLQPTVSLADDACTKLMTSVIHEHVISRAYLQNSSHTVTNSFLSIMCAWKTLLIHKLATLDQVHKIRLETKNWTSLLTTLQQELSMSTTFWSFHSLILQIKNNAIPSAG